MKALYKSELAAAAGVSRTTFYRWMKRHRLQLHTMGVDRNTHILPPKAVRWICQEYGIEL